MQPTYNGVNLWYFKPRLFPKTTCIVFEISKVYWIWLQRYLKIRIWVKFLSFDSNFSDFCLIMLERSYKINMILERWFFLSGALWIPVNHLVSTNTVVRYQPANGFNWFANHRKYLLDPTRLGKAWGDYRSGIGTGIGTVLPIPGGSLRGPQWGLLQIPFPYDSLL